MAAPEIDLSIVLSIFNEDGHIEKEIARIREAMDSSPYTYEIVVVDDGSSDRSVEVLRGIAGIRLIELAQNRGSGSGRKIGTRAARGRYVAWTDVDMTYPNDEIPRLVKEIDGFDQVVGARTSEQGTVKFLRVPAKWFLRKLAGYLTETDIPDLNSGLRVFRRDVALQYLHLLPKGFSCVTTMTMTFLAHGYSVKYVPIDYFARAGYSKFHWWSDTRRYLLQIVRMVLLYNPLKVFMPLGLTLLAVGSAKLVWDLFDKNFRVGTNTLVVGGVAFAVIMIGLLSDLIVQVNKPRDEIDPASR